MSGYKTYRPSQNVEDRRAHHHPGDRELRKRIKVDLAERELQYPDPTAPYTPEEITGWLNQQESSRG